MSYRVVYGESRPAWEQIFPTEKEAKAFAKKHRSFGDIVFSIKKVVPGEPPQSMTAAIDEGAIGRAERLMREGVDIDQAAIEAGHVFSTSARLLKAALKARLQHAKGGEA